MPEAIKTPKPERDTDITISISITLIIIIGLSETPSIGASASITIPCKTATGGLTQHDAASPKRGYQDFLQKTKLRVPDYRQARHYRIHEYRHGNMPGYMNWMNLPGI